MFGLVSGLKFVLDKVATAAASELDDEPLLRERLLQAQLDLEEGRIGEAEFQAREAVIFAKLRELKAERGEGPLDAGRVTIDAIEADVGDAPPRGRR